MTNSKINNLPPKKSNIKVIIGVLAVTLIIIIAALLFFFLSAESEKEKFIGTWELESITGDINGNITTNDGNGTKIIFNSDNTFKMSYKSYYVNGEYQPYTHTGNWKNKDEKLHIYADSTSDSNEGIYYTYKFSNNDKTLTLNKKYKSNDFYREMTYIYNKI